MAYFSVLFHKSLNQIRLNQTLLWKFNAAQPHSILNCLAWEGKAHGTAAQTQAQQLNSCYWKRQRELRFCPWCYQEGLLFPVLPLWSKIPSTVKETATSTGSWQTHLLSIQLTSAAPPYFTFHSKQNNQKCKLWVHKPEVHIAPVVYHSLLIWSRNSPATVGL